MGLEFSRLLFRYECVSDVIYTNTEHAYDGFKDINANKNLNGRKLKVNQKEYENGFSCHASSMIALKVPTPENGIRIKKFKVMCGIDDSATEQKGFTSSMKFMIFDFDPTPRAVCEPAAALAHSGLFTRSNNIDGLDWNAAISVI